MRQTLDRASKFLNLVARISALLAAVAVGIASREFTSRHLDDCAMLRVLGQPQRTIALQYLTEFALVGLLANAVAIPWVTLVVTPLAMLGVAFAPLWDAAAWAVHVLSVLLQWCAGLPLATLSMATPPWWMAACGVGGGALLAMRLPWSLRAVGVPFLLPVLLWQAPRPATGEFELLAADIGQGNAVLVRTATHSLLYDTGPRYSLESDAGHRVLVPLLRAYGERLDMLVLADENVRRDAHALHDWLLAERIEVAFAPTALAEPLVAMAWPADAALRVLLTGADKLTVRPAPGLPFIFVNNYGPTESTVVATSGIVSPYGEGLPSIGKPIAGTEVYLFDGEGDPVPYGEEAEIFIGGAQLARGYRGDPALTAMKFL
eukprot:gene3709-5058_t